MENQKEKLNRVLREIHAIIKREDLAAAVTICLPSEGEIQPNGLSLYHIEPTWALTKKVTDHLYKLEYTPTTKSFELENQKLKDTASMLMSLTKGASNNGEKAQAMLVSLSKALEV